MDAVLVILYHLVRGGYPDHVGDFLALPGAVPVVGDYVWHPNSRNKDDTLKHWRVVARLHSPEPTTTARYVHVHDRLDLLVEPVDENPFVDAAPADVPNSR